MAWKHKDHKRSSELINSGACLFKDILGQQVKYRYLAEALRLVHAGAVDQQRMEKDGVTLLHLQVHPGVLRVVATHSVVHLVHTTLRDPQTVYMCLYFLSSIFFLELSLSVWFVCVLVCTSHSG